jgi:hypothetical protein
MENDICNFTVIESPNRRYANTVNIVFFRAFPLTKNFQKYLDGLKEWKKYIKFYPDSQLQIFIDRSIAEDETIAPILHSLGARIYLFECPEFMRADKFHKGLFGTLVRFFPMFDINTHALNIAHFQELEPDLPFTYLFSDIDKLSKMKSSHNLNVIYESHNMFRRRYKEHPYFGHGAYYPWMVAGRFTVIKNKTPISLLTNYLEDVKQGKKFLNRYEGYDAVKPEHENFSYGIDESFLNCVYLPWLIENDYGIGIVQDYHLSHSVFFLKYEIRKDKRSKEFFDYILQKKQSLKESLNEFDRLFYKKNGGQQYIDRFFDIIEKYPNWLGRGATYLLKTVFYKRVARKCMIVVRNNNIVDIVDF